MASDPSYVRLRASLSKGMRYDEGGSGWSIAGLDVQPFPKDKEQARYVRQELAAGRLEPASKAEFEEAHPDGEDELPEPGTPHQEGQVQEAARKTQAALEASRGDSKGEEPEEDTEDEDTTDDEGEEPEAKDVKPAKRATSKKAAAKKK